MEFRPRLQVKVGKNVEQTGDSLIEEWGHCEKGFKDPQNRESEGWGMIQTIAKEGGLKLNNFSHTSEIKIEICTFVSSKIIFGSMKYDIESKWKT